MQGERPVKMEGVGETLGQEAYNALVAMPEGHRVRVLAAAMPEEYREALDYAAARMRERAVGADRTAASWSEKGKAEEAARWAKRGQKAIRVMNHLRALSEGRR